MIALVSDIHANIWAIKAMSLHLEGKDIKDIIISGDITNGPTSDLNEVFYFLKNFNIYAIPGNIDTQKTLQYLQKNNYSIHNETKKLGKLKIAGFGGGLSYGIGYFLNNEQTIKQEIWNLLEYNKPDIFTTHLPPFNTKIDLSKSNIHSGSQVIKDAIKFFQPKFWISGHVHEAKGTEKIGKTFCINPGSLKDGSYALLNPEKSKVIYYKVKI